jgi:hypothetical protein
VEFDLFETLKLSAFLNAIEILENIIGKII